MKRLPFAKFPINVIFDGERSSVSKNKVDAFNHSHARMLIAPPPEPGTYKLVLTLVKEGKHWFEENGFTPAEISVRVLSSNFKNPK